MKPGKRSKVAPICLVLGAIEKKILGQVRKKLYEICGCAFITMILDTLCTDITCCLILFLCVNL